MLDLTILDNDIIYNNLYHVNIFQNAHLVAYGETHMHTPPKSVHPIMDKLHTMGKNKTRGYVDQEIGIQNIKRWENKEKPHEYILQGL